MDYHMLFKMQRKQHTCLYDKIFKNTAFYNDSVGLINTQVLEEAACSLPAAKTVK